jgi:Family of unknown function (DUF6338)
MDIFFFQLAIIFLPGLIWERVDAQYLQKRVPTQFDVLRRTFVFGLVAYLVTYAIADLAGLRFEFVKPNKDEIFLGVTAVNQVIVTTVAAFICSILWMYFVKLDLLTKVVHLIGASKQFGDEDVWDFTFNARDKNVEYVHLRDFGKKIVYAGWVELFSGTDKVRELVLHDVEVFDFDGNLLFSAPRVYIARPMDSIDVEFPAEPGHDQEPAQGHEPAKVQDPAEHEELLQDQALTLPDEPAQDEEPAKDQEHADV